MIQIKFKNLSKSELVRHGVQERIDALIEKFEDLMESHIQVTLEMENSPIQAGPDFFKVKLHITRGRYDGVIIEKSASSLYVALADVFDHSLEVLNRCSDRARVKQRKKARDFKKDLAV
jgi:ribosome-associated translation inhibitor RaiA